MYSLTLHLSILPISGQMSDVETQSDDTTVYVQSLSLNSKSTLPFRCEKSVRLETMGLKLKDVRLNPLLGPHSLFKKACLSVRTLFCSSLALLLVKFAFRMHGSYSLLLYAFCPNCSLPEIAFLYAWELFFHFICILLQSFSIEFAFSMHGNSFLSLTCLFLSFMSLNLLFYAWDLFSVPCILFLF